LIPDGLWASSINYEKSLAKSDPVLHPDARIVMTDVRRNRWQERLVGRPGTQNPGRLRRILVGELAGEFGNCRIGFGGTQLLIEFQGSPQLFRAGIFGATSH
jgi:hypothetical protein